MKRTRRDALKMAASAPLAAAQAKRVPLPKVVFAHAPKFFTPAEFALVDELTEMIIPTDAHSPGARAAKVAAYIDTWLADVWEPEPRQIWRDGLRLIDNLCDSRYNVSFIEATPKTRIELLESISPDDDEPKTMEGEFFVELKKQTVHAYYTSDIGIHRDMEYKGNTYLDAFVGYDPK